MGIQIGQVLGTTNRGKRDYKYEQFNPNLGVILHLRWFSLNNSEMVKVVTLVFCSIQ